MTDTTHETSTSTRSALQSLLEDVHLDFHAIEQRVVAHPGETGIVLEDHNGRLPIHLLCCFTDACMSTFRTFIEANPDSLLVQDTDRDTPLHLACWFLSADVAHLFLKKCPEAATVKGNNGFIPLTVACYRYVHSGNSEWLRVILDLLLVEPTCATAVDDRGRPPMMTLWTWNTPNDEDSHEDRPILSAKTAFELSERSYDIALLLLLAASKDGEFLSLRGPNEFCQYGMLNGNEILDGVQTHLSGIILALVKVGKECGIPLPLSRIIVKNHQEQLFEADENGRLPIQILRDRNKEDNDHGDDDKADMNFLSFLESYQTTTTFFLLQKNLSITSG